MKIFIRSQGMPEMERGDASRQSALCIAVVLLSGCQMLDRDSGATLPSGNVKWSFETGGAIISAPVVSGGVVYVGSDDGHLYAVDAATGKERWKLELRGFMKSSPVIDGGAILFESLDEGIPESNFYAVDMATGKERWRFTSEWTTFQDKEEPTSTQVYLSPQYPVVSGGVVYFTSSFGTLYGLDTATGKMTWRFASEKAIVTYPAIEDGLLFFTDVAPPETTSLTFGWNVFHVLDEGNKSELATFDHSKLSCTIMTAPVLYEGAFYFNCEGSEWEETPLKVVGLNATSGDLVFSRHSWETRADPLVAGDTIYHSGYNDGSKKPFPLIARAVRGPGSGDSRIWLFESRGPIRAPPAVSGGVLYVGTFGKYPNEGGNLYAIDAETGKELWKYKPGSHVSSSPVVADGTVYLGTMDGHLHAIDVNVAV